VNWDTGRSIASGASFPREPLRFEEEVVDPDVELLPGPDDEPHQLVPPHGHKGIAPATLDHAVEANDISFQVMRHTKSIDFIVFIVLTSDKYQHTKLLSTKLL
jgi:hypothetical protein